MTPEEQRKADIKLLKERRLYVVWEPNYNKHPSLSFTSDGSKPSVTLDDCFNEEELEAILRILRSRKVEGDEVLDHVEHKDLI